MKTTTERLHPEATTFFTVIATVAGFNPAITV